MPEFVDVRQRLAAQAIELAADLVDNIYWLEQLKDQRARMGHEFQDSDFIGQKGLEHLTPYLVGSLFDFVVPALNAFFLDEANGGRNANILMQVRPGARRFPLGRT